MTTLEYKTTCKQILEQGFAMSFGREKYIAKGKLVLKEFPDIDLTEIDPEELYIIFHEPLREPVVLIKEVPGSPMEHLSYKIGVCSVMLLNRLLDEWAERSCTETTE